MYVEIQAKSFAIAPIFQGEQLWGLLAGYQNEHPRFWKEGEIRLLTQTGIQVGISIAQVDLFSQIQNQSLQLQQGDVLHTLPRRGECGLLRDSRQP